MCGESDLLLSEAYRKIDMLTKLVDKAEAGMYVTDYHTCEILYVNRKMVSYTKSGLTAEDMLGKPCWSFVNLAAGGAEGRCKFCPYEKLVDSCGNPVQPYEWEQHFPNVGVWLKIVSEAIRWVDGRLANIVTFFDITEMKKTEQQLADLAYVDRRLRLKNSVKLEQDILEDTRGLLMIVLDIVALQRVNDAFGRNIGDELLCAVRDWILGQAGGSSELYRIGGDEFALTVRGKPERETVKLAETMLERFTRPWVFRIDNAEVNILCSAAVGIIRGEYISAGESLFNLIGRTLKTAKNAGALVVYSEEIDCEFKRQLNLEWSLKRCVYEDMRGFVVYFQPIAVARTGKWCGVEALCRWNSPELGCIPPHTFIPEAERLALIGRIGLWVLETSVRSCKQWQLDKCDDFVLNVNLSAVQFSDALLSEKVFSILREYDYPCHKLCLEITESNRFTFTDYSLGTIDFFRKNGILVALDDFGTGYSNFANLKSLPVDIIKIERDFTVDIESNNYHLYLYRAMTDLAHAADARLIAEGVETSGQMDMLVANGADYLQGYLFAKPLHPIQLERELRRFVQP